MTALNMSGFSLSVIELDNDITTGLLGETKVEAWQKMRLFVEPSKIKSPELSQLIPYKSSKNLKVEKIM